MNVMIVQSKISNPIEPSSMQSRVHVREISSRAQIICSNCDLRLFYFRPRNAFNLLLREAIASSLRLITCLFSFYGSDFDYLENCGEHVKFDYHHLPYRKSNFSFSLFVEYKVEIAAIPL